jgi:hypothetical protein
MTSPLGLPGGVDLARDGLLVLFHETDDELLGRHREGFAPTLAGGLVGRGRLLDRWRASGLSKGTSVRSSTEQGADLREGLLDGAQGVGMPLAVVEELLNAGGEIGGGAVGHFGGSLSV